MIKQDLEPYLETLSTCELFRGIDGESLCALLERMRARVARYARGETIFRCGDDVRESAVVLEGTVMVEDSDIEGEDINLNMLGRGEEFGSFLVLCGNARNPMHVYAGSRCAVLIFDLSAVSQSASQTEEDWRLLDNVVRCFAQKCTDLYEKVRIYGKKRIRSRVRIYLMSLEPEGDEVVLPMNRTALAAYLGVDRTALARELSRMQAEGLIAVDGRRVRLLDRDFFQLGRQTPSQL